VSSASAVDGAASANGGRRSRLGARLAALLEGVAASVRALLALLLEEVVEGMGGLSPLSAASLARAMAFSVFFFIDDVLMWTRVCWCVWRADG
jgi:hypothetical protein